jgi:hypothetical protein
MLKSSNKPGSKSWLFLFIPSSCFFKFPGSFPADLYLQNQTPIRDFALERTSSRSRESAFPDSISLIRRQISMSHASAISPSIGPSRLATKSLANLARSLSDRVIAAFLRASSSAVLIFALHKGEFMKMVRSRSSCIVIVLSTLQPSAASLRRCAAR